MAIFELQNFDTTLIMNFNNKITFEFITEHTNINFGRKVHGVAVMNWITKRLELERELGLKPFV